MHFLNLTMKNSQLLAIEINKKLYIWPSKQIAK